MLRRSFFKELHYEGLYHSARSTRGKVSDMAFPNLFITIAPAEWLLPFLDQSILHLVPHPVETCALDGFMFVLCVFWSRLPAFLLPYAKAKSLNLAQILVGLHMYQLVRSVLALLCAPDGNRWFTVHQKVLTFVSPSHFPFLAPKASYICAFACSFDSFLFL